MSMGHKPPDDRIRVFVSYSFDPADDAIVKLIINILKSNRNLSVLTAHDPMPESIEHKIEDRIDNSDVIFGIFTSRYAVTDAAGNRMYLPPPFVVGETSYAIGSYRPYQGQKLVCGAIEKGIDLRKDIGLLGLRDTELIPFERGQAFSEYRDRLREYIKKLPQKLGRTKGALRLPYQQLLLEKRITVYRDGRGVVENRVTVQILGAESFKGITHFLAVHSASRQSVPSFAEMQKNGQSSKPLEELSRQPFFVARLISWNNVDPYPKWSICAGEVSSSASEVTFRLGFTREVKDRDRIVYEYAWGMPGFFETTKADLSFGETSYFWLTSTHGIIQKARFVLRFERGFEFSKEPYCLVSPFPRAIDPKVISSASLPADRTEYNLWYTTFSWDFQGFWGTAMANWIPS